MTLSDDDRAVFDQTVDPGPHHGDDSARVITASSPYENFRIDRQRDAGVKGSLVVQLVPEDEVLVRESQDN